MKTKIPLPPRPILYPETDGKPVAEDTLHFDSIRLISEELKELFWRNDNVFVAGNLFWYPVEGMPSIVKAPDVMVALGRPPGFRWNYLQWEEGGIAPQVVFEICSSSNTNEDLTEKFNFYDRYGVEEYYLIDPFSQTIEGWTRGNDRLVPIQDMDGWVSPRLGIRFEATNGKFDIYTPEGRKFVSREERMSQLEKQLKQTEQETQQLRQSRLRTEKQTRRADASDRKFEAMAAKLRELGIDPDKLF